MQSILPSILGVIGNTPLVQLDRLVKHFEVDGSLLVKLEYMNPGFSKKDRAALGVIEEAEKAGLLKPGQTVVELTSGNMGTGLAIVCGIKGYPFVAVMSKGNSIERAQMMAALGAEVILVDQAIGSIPGQVSGADLERVDEAAQHITQLRHAFRADQFHRRGNWLSHYHGTGPEIWAQTEGKIDYFVDFLGSGGTFAGVTKALKERKPSIQCYAVEPEGAAAVAGLPITDINHPIQGGGYAYADLDFLSDVPIDGFLQVSGDAAKEMARALAKYEGIFGGFSGGANVAAAIQLLKRNPGNTVVTGICDSGLKYLSTDLWKI
ncbi:MAG: cysteine synthase family protein [Ottowia sp.]|nr:cysteine synthase family protein [Ottowia sp.]